MKIIDVKAVTSPQSVPLLVLEYEDEEWGRGTYQMPEYTFEARAGEYELDDVDEVIEMVLLEPFTELGPSGDPYNNDVGTARGHKRALIAQAKKSRQVSYASPAVKKKLRDLVSFKPENVGVFKEHADTARMSNRAAREAAAKKPAGALATLHEARARAVKGG